MSETKKLFTVEQVLRLAISVFLIGGAWARLEYKVDEMNTATKTLLEKYIISNDYDKKIINLQIGSLSAQVNVNTTTIETIANFIKPEEPTLKNYNHGNN